MVKNGLLKSYKNRVWDLIEDFQAFDIQSIPRNKYANRLVAIGAQYDISKHVEDDKEQHIRVSVRPFILDNYANWQVCDSNE